MSRRLQSDGRLFVNSLQVNAEPVLQVEGTVLPAGAVEAKRLIVGENGLLLQVSRHKGYVELPHTHPDHESIAYLIKGKLKMRIGDREFIAEPGCAWIHPANVEHSSMALEDTVQIEVKTPPVLTWGE